MAIAVALSSNPSNSFAVVMLAGTGLPLESIHSFLTRLLLERPMFGRSQILGAVIGLLLSPAFRETVLKEPLTELLKLSNVTESIALALDRYFVVRDPDELWKGYVRLALHESNETSSRLRFPDSIFVPLRY